MGTLLITQSGKMKLKLGPPDSTAAVSSSSASSTENSQPIYLDVSNGWKGREGKGWIDECVDGPKERIGQNEIEARPS